MIFVQLGCGENHLAAEWILAVVVHEGFPPPAALLTTLTTWLDPYVGTRRVCIQSFMTLRRSATDCSAPPPLLVVAALAGAHTTLTALPIVVALAVVIVLPPLCYLLWLTPTEKWSRA